MRIKVNGNDKTELYSGHLGQVNIVGDWIIAGGSLNENNKWKNGVLRMKADGSQKEIILEHNTIFFFNVKGEWLYFVDTLDPGSAGESHLYKVRLDGTDLTRIKGVNYISRFNIIDDYIYFIHSDNIMPPFPTYRIKMDGTGLQLLE